MPKYKVYGIVSIGVTIKVEAGSKEDAIDAAYSEFEGLSGYCGNGGTNKLIGTSQGNVCLDADGEPEPEFIEAEET